LVYAIKYKSYLNKTTNIILNNEIIFLFKISRI